MGVDTTGLAGQFLAVCCRGHGLGHLDRLQSLDGCHGAHTTSDLDLPLVHHRMRDVCLGCLDPAEFRHAGQLSAVGHYRHSGIGQDVVGLITFLQLFWLRVFSWLRVVWPRPF